MPRWPEPPPLAPRSSRSLSPTVLAAGLAISIGANVAMLIALLVVLVLARTGALAPNSSANGPASGQPTATSSFTPAATATSSTTGWLQLTPSNVHLGCDGGQQTQYVVLANSGSEDVHWQIDNSGSSDQLGIAISPRRGDLRAGTSVSIQLQNRSGSDGQQGTLAFSLDSTDAGTPPSLSYTTDGC